MYVIISEGNMPLMMRASMVQFYCLKFVLNTVLCLTRIHPADPSRPPVFLILNKYKRPFARLEAVDAVRRPVLDPEAVEVLDFAQTCKVRKTTEA